MCRSDARPTPPSQKNRKQVKVGAISYAQLVLHMLQGDLTCKELAKETGLHYVTVLQYARELHAVKAAYISCWEKDSLGRDNIKVYKIGKGRDAKRSAQSRAEIARTYRSKLRGIEMSHALAGVMA